MKLTLAARLLLLLPLSAGAQTSSVTIYGKVDQGFGKAIGSSTREIFDAGGVRTSRIGFRGVEDLGGGYSSGFILEHRLAADTGMSTSPTVFWQGESDVYLTTPYGRVTLGRQFTPSFSLVQNVIDPWNGETVAALRAVAMQGPQTTRIGGTLGPPAPARVRFASMLRYDYNSSFGLNVAAAIAQASTNGGPDRPYSLAASYTFGSWLFAAAYENAADVQDKLWNLGIRYALGTTGTLRAGYSFGQTGVRANGQSSDVRAWLVATTFVVGVGNIRTGYATSVIRDPSNADAGGDDAVAKKLSLGYEYFLSKRTKLYADVAHDRRAVRERTGFDMGIQHNF